MDAGQATALLAAQQDAFLKFVRRQVGDPDLALDVLQDGFLKALTKIGELRDDARLVPWFYSVLRTTAADLLRRRSQQARLATELAAAGPEDVAPSDGAAEKGPLVAACLEGLLKQMTPAYAEVIRELDLAEADAVAYAREHGLSAGALKVKRHRARRQLEELLTTACRCPVDPTADCVCGCA